MQRQSSQTVWLLQFPVATKAAFQADPGNQDIMLSTIASILSGSVFGDHISPISDTTILSAIACRCAPICCKGLLPFQTMNRENLARLVQRASRSPCAATLACAHTLLLCQQLQYVSTVSMVQTMQV